ncbi:carboxypeptidase-like regulatory domain-containing protein [Arthrobacter sp. MMS18-M83]|uniref:carboxypeptidase-like regulatory domain-containing protein n=1 Tax=Arthrobacter sp. MMS18-M83 TaxID=2996261 RepID=UPI00227BC8CE|nr:carboxypeptidase-like regulatory domain-containing protein [Arthrobacter sp. MMS18-M83]WAH98236.1 carboxypeptidase-like regulatory domain-containing protein [Arthrobacter sp. MMS18-M83]
METKARRGFLALVTILLLFLSALVSAVPAQAAGTGSISGTVTVPDGIDVTQIAVVVFHAPDVVNPTHPDADGTYTVTGLPAGSYPVSFQAGPDGYGVRQNVVSRFYGGDGSGLGTPVNVAAGEAKAGIDVQLVLGATISGMVTVPEGIDVSQISATAFSLSGGSFSPSFGAVDSDGTYTVVGLPAGTYRVNFGNFPADPNGVRQNVVPRYYGGDGSFANATPVAVAAGEARAGIDVQMALGATISGTVTVPEGIDVSQIFAVALPSGPGAGVGGSAAVKADGSYTVVGLPAGSYKLNFGSQKEMPQNVVSRFYGGDGSFANATPVVVAAGEAKEGTDVELALGATISGTVTVPDGVDVSQIFVSATSSASGFGGGAAVQSDGTYTIVGLAAGSYKVYFVGKGTPVVSRYYGGDGSVANATPVMVAPGGALAGIDVVLVLAAPR